MKVLVLSQEQAKLDTHLLDQLLETKDTGKKGTVLRKDESIGEHYILNTQVQLVPLSWSHEHINNTFKQALLQGYNFLQVNLNEQNYTNSKLESTEKESE